MNQNKLVIKAVKFLKYFQKPLNRFTEIILLFAFTVVAYLSLLYFVKYLWIIFTATDVGQTYALIYEESYRITNDVLNRNFISLAINITLTASVICFLVGSMLKFLHLIRYFYSARGFLGRIIFAGLPLTFIVAIYVNYSGYFSYMDTAYTVSFVPTLCVFAGFFRFAEDFVPKLVDIMFIFSRKKRTISRDQKVEVLNRTDESTQKTNRKHVATVWQLILQDIWESFETYITVILIIILVVGILFVIPQMQTLTKIELPKQTEAPTDMATEQITAPVTEENNSDERFIAYPDKTVLDKKSRLMWAVEESETLSWHDAKRYCKKYRGGGYRDWRMPSVAELEGLYDSSKQPDCGCVTNLIEMSNDANCWEWSSETKDSDAAFFAFNLNGKQWLPKSNNSSVHIRPVRVYR